MFKRRLTLLAGLCTILATAPAAAQDGPPPEVRAAIDGVLAMLRASDDASLATFAADHLAPSYRTSFAGDALTRHLRSLRDAARGHLDGVGVERGDDDVLILMLGGEQGVKVRLALGDGGKVTRLELAQPVKAGPTEQPAPPKQISYPPATRADARPFHVRALFGVGSISLDSAMTLFDRQHFSAAYLKSTTPAERRALLGQVREAAAAAGNVRANEDASGVHIQLEGPGSPGVMVDFTMENATPFGIATLHLRAMGAADRPPAAPPLTWDGLAARLREAEAAGVAGQIYAHRAGQDATRTTFGIADRTSGARTTPNLIYCIGSTPIDFTMTAASLLIERGRLGLDESIAKYLPDVPADKAPMTIRMILEGRSGLPNFHHREGDADPDLTYIDRATALRRILTQPLLFAPGAQRQPSHSSFALLAAIIESVSGKSYPEFVRSEILKPLGMTRTGFYGESLGLADHEFAPGYGTRSQGTPNIPPKWGPVSWLVMGSGGMFSTLDDLRRYYDGMARGALFADHHPVNRLGSVVGGSDRGFIFTRTANGAGDEVYLLSNTEQGPATQALVESLMSLVPLRR
ncbi:MAG: serine hydrolase domain-containing protein [Gemmatimonadota bacterium]